MRSTLITLSIALGALVSVPPAGFTAEPAPAHQCGAGCKCGGEGHKCGPDCKCGGEGHKCGPDCKCGGEGHKCGGEHGAGCKCGHHGAAAADPAAAPAEAAKPVKGKIDVAVTEKGFEPARIEVQKGKPLTVVFTRKTERTCAKEVVIDEGAGKVEHKLPMNEPVTVKLTFKKAGEVPFTCAMNMIKGVFVVK